MKQTKNSWFFIFLLISLIGLISCAQIQPSYASYEDCVIKDMEGKSDLLIEEVRSECRRKTEAQKKPEKTKGFLGEIKIFEGPISEGNPHPPGTVDYEIWEDNHYIDKKSPSEK